MKSKKNLTIAEILEMLKKQLVRDGLTQDRISSIEITLEVVLALAKVVGFEEGRRHEARLSKKNDGGWL